jgi:crotonobetainyl-CoA:carnitine CoA-transferase CaiB-like acyl-CoA transferase
VENAGEGDWSRVLGARYGDHTAFSIIGNMGKRSVAIDLKVEQGKQVLWRLLRGADVFLEGFRPGVIRRLGFDYEAVSAREPRLLYVSISGFGQTGPLAERPAMDPVLQAFTGLTAENKGEDGIPHRVPVIPVDMATSLYAFQALSAALYARRDEPRGRHIDVSLLQGAASLQAIRMMASKAARCDRGACPMGSTGPATAGCRSPRFMTASGARCAGPSSVRSWRTTNASRTRLRAIATRCRSMRNCVPCLQRVPVPNGRVDSPRRRSSMNG